MNIYFKYIDFYNMGVASSTKELVIATVNYSGILHSPFEFYS